MSYDQRGALGRLKDSRVKAGLICDNEVCISFRTLFSAQLSFRDGPGCLRRTAAALDLFRKSTERFLVHKKPLL